jgi:hypothetical protein
MRQITPVIPLNLALAIIGYSRQLDPTPSRLTRAPREYLVEEVFVFGWLKPSNVRIV